MTRSQLCELLWDVPNDPRGELRWCLSRIRTVIDEPGRQRIVTAGDTVGLDISDCIVDISEIAQAAQHGFANLAVERLRELVSLFRGEVLEDVDIDRSPLFNNWLVAQRRRLRACRTALLEQLVKSAPDEEAFGYLDQWLELAPFDQRVHEILLKALARHGRFKEGEEHLAAIRRLFQTEGLDDAPLRELWRVAKTEASAAPPPQTASTSVASAAEAPADPPIRMSRRASIAVMPFAERDAIPGTAVGPAAGPARDLPQDLPLDLPMT